MQAQTNISYDSSNQSLPKIYPNHWKRISGLGGIWTPDLLSASQAFIPAELPARIPESDTILWYLGFASLKKKAVG